MTCMTSFYIKNYPNQSEYQAESNFIYRYEKIYILGTEIASLLMLYFL